MIERRETEGSKTRELIYRHPLVVRITHWINAACLAILFMSGLQIFNAHPSLYLGHISTFDKPVLDLKAVEKTDGGLTGVTSVLGTDLDTTGVLGASFDAQEGKVVARGFPSWITVPSYQDLATGRKWHFFFAWLFVINGVIYVVYSLASRHAWRDLVPSREQLRHIGRSIIDHARLRFPEGEEAKTYNVLQRLSYLVVIFAILPVTILAGLTMSPGLNAAFPWMLDLFGGRQSARTIHFIGAWAMVAFVIVHVVMVVVSGLLNNMRSMITGWFAVDKAHE